MNSRNFFLAIIMAMLTVWMTGCSDEVPLSEEVTPDNNGNIQFDVGFALSEFQDADGIKNGENMFILDQKYGKNGPELWEFPSISKTTLDQNAENVGYAVKAGFEYGLWSVAMKDGANYQGTIIPTVSGNVMASLYSDGQTLFWEYTALEDKIVQTPNNPKKVDYFMSTDLTGDYDQVFFVSTYSAYQQIETTKSGNVWKSKVPVSFFSSTSGLNWLLVIKSGVYGALGADDARISLIKVGTTTDNWLSKTGVFNKNAHKSIEQTNLTAGAPGGNVWVSEMDANGAPVVTASKQNVKFIWRQTGSAKYVQSDGIAFRSDVNGTRTSAIVTPTFVTADSGVLKTGDIVLSANDIPDGEYKIAIGTGTTLANFKGIPGSDGRWLQINTGAIKDIHCIKSLQNTDGSYFQENRLIFQGGAVKNGTDCKSDEVNISVNY